MSKKRTTPFQRSSGQLPDVHQEASFLIQETKTMEIERRKQEQDAERRLGSVKIREQNPEQHNPQALEGELQNSIPQHPLLNKQRFDGVDPQLNPEPPLNTSARTEYDNERREQENEKRLRLELGMQPGFNPKPRGP